MRTDAESLKCFNLIKAPFCACCVALWLHFTEIQRQQCERQKLEKYRNTDRHSYESYSVYAASVTTGKTQIREEDVLSFTQHYCYITIIRLMSLLSDIMMFLLKHFVQKSFFFPHYILDGYKSSVIRVTFVTWPLKLCGITISNPLLLLHHE